MDRIRHFADVSVRRGLGFAMLGIFSVMAGLAFAPALAAKAGAVLSAIVACVMAVKAWNAPGRPYRATEVYVMLDGRLGVPEEAAQRAIGHVLRDCYRRHAEIMAAVATGLWIVSLFLSGLGIGSAI